MNFLQQNNKKLFNSLFFRLITYLLSAFIYAHFAGLSLPDDGLRHIAFAAHSDVMHSWGDAFPHSLFFTNYDPWYIWHQIIRFYLLFFSYECVHLAINTTVLFVLMLLLDRLFIRYATLKNAPLGIFIILSIVLLSSFRYINIRPDLLSGLFLISALLLNRNYILLFLLTLLYAPSYYLFFLYSGSVGLLYIVLKNYKALLSLVLGSLLGLFIHLYFGGQEFISTILYLLKDQSLREGLKVGEGVALFEILGVLNYYILVALAWALSFVIIFTNYAYFKRRPIALLLLIMSPLWLAQVRYLAILKPLFYLYFFLEFRTFMKLFSRDIQYSLLQLFHILKSVQYKVAFLIPALLYTSFMLGYLMNDFDYSTTLEEKRYYQNKNLNHQTILLNRFTIDIYYALYLNPTLKFIPSCSIGWFENNAKMKDIYIRMMKDEGINEKELQELLDFLDVRYYLHALANKDQTLSFAKLKELGIEPKLILDNKILFEREKK